MDPVKLVIVTWLDAQDPDTPGWKSEEDMVEFEADEVVVTSVGWVKSESKKFLTLVADKIPHMEEPGRFTYSRATKIPVGMIQKIEEVKV